MRFEGITNEYLRVEEIDPSNCFLLKEIIESGLTLLWFTENDSELVIDNQKQTFQCNEIICLTEFHKVSINKFSKAKMVRFNRSFYCILDHDSEVGCKGVLFFGASQLPIIHLPEKEIEKFETLWRMFVMEMESKDKLQQEMLQMMLKRLLILCTRLHKEQNNYTTFNETNLDLVREFNFLIEQHFRTKHTVAAYAEMLNKSPKTIANLFTKLGSKTPLQYIQDRRMLEARRLLHHTQLSVKEIAYEMGYEDVQTFSRFFKNYEGISPSVFKEKNSKGKIANA